MSAGNLVIRGVGAVSPLGWSAQPLAQAVLTKAELPVEETVRVEGAPVGKARRVPAWSSIPPWMKQPRFRRTTIIAKYALAAVYEALGEERLALINAGKLKVGVVFCTMNGCVQFSRRFYAEVLNQPLLASPILFPETVYNAPSSHLSALLGSIEINYTLVGDSNEFVRGMEVAAQWLDEEDLDGCLVVSAEEGDWLSDEALELFRKDGITAEGSAAIYLEKAAILEEGDVVLEVITETQNFTQRISRKDSLELIYHELKPWVAEPSLFFSGEGIRPTFDRDEALAFQGIAQNPFAVRKVVGEGFSCTGGWQVVCAAFALKEKVAASQAIIHSAGLFQQNVGLVLKRV